MHYTFQITGFRAGERRLIFQQQGNAAPDDFDPESVFQNGSETVEANDNPNQAADAGMNTRTNAAEVNQKTAKDITNNAVRNAFNSLKQQNGGDANAANATMSNLPLYRNFTLKLVNDQLDIKPRDGTDASFASVDEFIAAQQGLTPEQGTALKGALDLQNAPPAVQRLLPEVLQMLHDNPELQ